MTTLDFTGEPRVSRRHLALALDVESLAEAIELARPLQPYFAVAKVGLELFSAHGPDAVAAMRDLGFDVFLDVKLHDIPNTVGKAATVLGRLGTRYLTMHASGGVPMLRAGVEGLATGASAAGLESPIALGVTVLTSDAEAPVEVFEARAIAARESGCGGLVCAVAEASRAKAIAPSLIVVTPGIRPAGVAANDQGRPATPAAALAAGADLLVIGRAVTAAAHPVEAARRILAELDGV
ncbi:MAG: orotidine-5'-phosphate decarboxylase [Acidimicrobiia bacterium]